jgi:hypothetical protein
LLVYTLGIFKRNRKTQQFLLQKGLHFTTGLQFKAKLTQFKEALLKNFLPPSPSLAPPR